MLLSQQLPTPGLKQYCIILEENDTIFQQFWHLHGIYPNKTCNSDYPHFIQQVKMMSLLWRYLLKHKINFCPDCMSHVTSVYLTACCCLCLWLTCSHMYATSQSSRVCTDQQCTSYSNTECSVFFFKNTHDSTFVCLWKDSAANVRLPVS
jgi:hypothetical protein